MTNAITSAAIGGEPVVLFKEVVPKVIRWDSTCGNYSIRVIVDNYCLYALEPDEHKIMVMTMVSTHDTFDEAMQFANELAKESK